MQGWCGVILIAARATELILAHRRTDRAVHTHLEARTPRGWPAGDLPEPGRAHQAGPPSAPAADPGRGRLVDAAGTDHGHRRGTAPAPDVLHREHRVEPDQGLPLPQ